MSEHDELPNIGGNCSEPGCNCMILLSKSYCTTHLYKSRSSPPAAPSNGRINGPSRAKSFDPFHSVEASHVAKRIQKPSLKPLIGRDSEQDTSHKSIKAISENSSPESRASAGQPTMSSVDRSSTPTRPNGVISQQNNVLSHELLHDDSDEEMADQVVQHELKDTQEPDLVGRNPLISQASKTISSSPTRGFLTEKPPKTLDQKLSQWRAQHWSQHRPRYLSSCRPLTESPTGTNGSSEEVSANIREPVKFSKASIRKLEVQASALLNATGTSRDPFFHHISNNGKGLGLDDTAKPKGADVSQPLDKRKSSQISHGSPRAASESALFASSQIEMPKVKLPQIRDAPRPSNEPQLEGIPELGDSGHDPSHACEEDLNPNPAVENTHPQPNVDGRRKTWFNKPFPKYDAAAIDIIIYQQSEMSPPDGVFIMPRIPEKPTTSSKDGRLFLPVNPAIHYTHNRSEQWHRRKAREIAARGGRKKWFGKVLERQRMLRRRKAMEERRRRKQRHEGAVPMRRDPQPRTYNRVQDFGDVPEKELPDDVASNPAWVKACAWFREARVETIQYQRDSERRRVEQAERAELVEKAKKAQEAKKAQQHLDNVLNGHQTE
ncbi:hypothetical protein G7046_g8105 [Stylonectria norvegica]|nr:hypothetical protein G7046_g8105 [Stylonectria norvegica]